jgi:hypothetical protein
MFSTFRQLVFSPRELYLQMAFVGDKAVSPAFSVIGMFVILCWCIIVLTSVFSTPTLLGVLVIALFTMILGLVIWFGIYLLNQLMCGVFFIAAEFLGMDRPRRFPFVVGGHAAIAWLLTGLIWVGGYIGAEMHRISANPQTDYEMRGVVGTQISRYYEPAFAGGLLLGVVLFGFFMWQGYYHTRYLNPEPTGEGEA